MESSSEITAVQRLISNRLDQSTIGEKAIAGIIGDGPSNYSKSPALWNAAFNRLGIRAVYLPFDVAAADVGALLAALKSSPRFMGVNVTVPHMMIVIDYLDGLDADAARIGAVNTIGKNSGGKLIGYNTDGAGFIDSILLPIPGERDPFVTSLDGRGLSFERSSRQRQSDHRQPHARTRRRTRRCDRQARPAGPCHR
jgi:hypothetical protein